MKEEKRFRFNIIDIIVLLVAVAAIVAVAMKMTGHLGGGSEPAGTTVTYTAVAKEVDPELYDDIAAFVHQAKAQGKEGDQLMASGELLNAYVTDVTAKPHDYSTLIIGFENGASIISTRETLDLTFTVKAYGVDTVKTEIGTQEVRVGKLHIMKTTHFELQNSTIMTCEWEGGTAADR